MASLERRLLLRFIQIFDAKTLENLPVADDTVDALAPEPGPEESALAILLSLHGDIVSFEGSVYRREGLSVVVYRDVPCLDPEAMADEAEPVARVGSKKGAGLVSQPLRRK